MCQADAKAGESQCGLGVKTILRARVPGCESCLCHVLAV